MGRCSKDTVKQYWERHPAGMHDVEHLPEGSREFFDARDALTRALYPYLDDVHRFADARGLRTLELGCGLGYNAQRLAQHGAQLTAVDLAERTVVLTRRRFGVRGLSAEFANADAESLPFLDEVFDIVHSSGVIHHSPNTDRCVAEIHRVLRPGGWAVVMIYHKRSLSYLRIMAWLRLLMIVLNLLPETLLQPVLRWRPGLSRYLVEDRPRWTTAADALRSGTEFSGALNPLSRAYSRSSARKLFGRFAEVTFTTAGTAPRQGTSLRARLSQLRARLDHRFGWFLYVYARKVG